MYNKFDIFPIEGGICAPLGFFASGVSAGLKKDGAPDVAFIYSEEICSVEALFTNNRFQAAPIRYFKECNDKNTNFVLINSKNANAMTSLEGIEDIKEVLGELKSRFEEISNPIMSSTGVIGVRLPKSKIIASFEKFDLSQKSSESASKAIMTTDAFAKEIALEVEYDGGSFRIGGIAKGAGMINPALATMLCFITTDADIPKNDQKEMLVDLAEESFNAISVDGDTSTNDSIFLLANRKSGSYNKEAFREALGIVMLKLATDIARDGEGAKKLVAFEVSGAKSYEEAKRAAKSLSNSLLVKTAIYGEDPNWGRIASTIGASGVECDEATLRISFDEVNVYDRGEVFFDEATEKKAASVMQKDSFKVRVDIGMGEGFYRAYGCDLGYEYVKINADYRT